MWQADVAILEEPEHLNWYHHGQRWTDKFDHVVGIIHTNYLDYARREEQGDIKEKCLKALNSWVCRIHCHKVSSLAYVVSGLLPMWYRLMCSRLYICSNFTAAGCLLLTQLIKPDHPTSPHIGGQVSLCCSAGSTLLCMHSYICTLQVVKLSDAVQPLPRQTTQFIHGVPQQFLAVGDKKSEPAAEGQERFSRGAYFMGKAVWAKGYTELLSLLESHRIAGKTEYAIDCYGNGEDLAAVNSSICMRIPPSHSTHCLAACQSACCVCVTSALLMTVWPSLWPRTQWSKFCLLLQHKQCVRSLQRKCIVPSHSMTGQVLCGWVCEWVLNKGSNRLCRSKLPPRRRI